MSFNYLSNISLEEAVKIAKSVAVAPSTEKIAVKDCVGRITAKAVYAEMSAPHYNACAMDGIAVVAAETVGASVVDPLDFTNYVVVDTGDPLPEGMDAVIMIEDVINTDDGIQITEAVAPWQNVRQVGEDICEGEMVLPSYTEITPSAAGALLAAGVLEVEVVKKPVVAIIPTGDEIVEASKAVKAGDIIEFNSTIFAGMVKEYGGEPHVYGIVKDKFEDLKAAVIKASQECDIILMNAGSSAGRDDYSTAIIEELGELKFHGVAIKPGKPAAIGTVNGKPIVIIPGYPVSGIVVVRELASKIITAMSKAEINEPQKVDAIFTKNVNSGLKYEEYVRVKIGRAAGKLTATPLSRGAGVVSSFVKADGIVQIEKDSEGIQQGSIVKVELLKPLSQIENTISIIGSHDPLMDEIADILKIEYGDKYVSSSHVGSMGGIMAIKRKEANIAGTHLLCDNGEYNIDYIQGVDAKLIRGVKRAQGFMVAKGNPKNIKGLEDLTKISYVNRQKGSGTRVLLDYLLKQKGINPADIYGYSREEFTHLSVAAQIADGSADAGLGIYSAAQAFGLDFIPVAQEQYDFLVEKSFTETEDFELFMSIIKSEEFARRLEALGGYTLDGTGEEVPF